jgi:CRP-like cAMP-binding protein
MAISLCLVLCSRVAGGSIASLQKTIDMNVLVASLLRERKLRFLEGMDAPDIKMILAAGTRRRFLPNSAIVNQGYPAGHLFLLLTGRVRRLLLPEDGQRVVLLQILPGEIFGEGAMLARPMNYIVSSEAYSDYRA